MDQVGTKVADAGGVPVAEENSRRIHCVSCNYTLLEIAVETPEGSRVWLKTKCKGCKTFNVVVMKDGRVSVSAVHQ